MTNKMPDPRTPVLIGVGQFCERIGDADYQKRSPADLAGEAARAALNDSGADVATLAAAVDTIATTRQFENSTPMARAFFGMSSNLPRSLAVRIGANPQRAVLEVIGGQSPQHLVNEFAREIAAGRADVVLLTCRLNISKRISTKTRKDRWKTVATDWVDC